MRPDAGEELAIARAFLQIGRWMGRALPGIVAEETAEPSAEADAAEAGSRFNINAGR